MTYVSNPFSILFLLLKQAPRSSAKLKNGKTARPEFEPRLVGRIGLFIFDSI